MFITEENTSDEIFTAVNAVIGNYRRNMPPEDAVVVDDSSGDESKGREPFVDKHGESFYGSEKGMFTGVCC